MTVSNTENTEHFSNSAIQLYYIYNYIFYIITVDIFTKLHRFSSVFYEVKRPKRRKYKIQNRIFNEA